MGSISKRMLLLALGLGFAGCRTVTTFSTESLAPPAPIQIDGRPDDWHGHLFAEGVRLEIGFLNDRENLYVCLLSKDSLTRAEILTQGLTVWFDPKGGTNRTFGVKFPVGLPPGEQKVSLRPSREGPKLEDLPDTPMNEIEILRGKEPPQRLSLADAKGIEVQVRSATDEIVYELKIPLVSSEQHPFPAGAEPGKTLGVGFESPPLEMTEMQGRPEGRRPRGTEGGEEGGEEGRGEGGRGEEGRGHYGGEQAPMNVWAVVQLAAG